LGANVRFTRGVLIRPLSLAGVSTCPEVAHARLKNPTSARTRPWCTEPGYALGGSRIHEIRYPTGGPDASDGRRIQLTTSSTPPTEQQCESVGRRCFSPQAIQAAYNVGPLYANHVTGKGVTIAIVDSYGSDTITHDLHVFDQAFSLQPMCGEEGVTCAAGLPTFSQFHFQGAPATNAPPATAKSPGQEAKSSWALEVSLDVEMAHAMAPMANILLVTTPTAETLGVQGFPDMMNAEQYVVDHHMANVISQSFASAEDAFGSAQSLLNLRHAYVSAAANAITVLGSSGDNGTANTQKTPVHTGGSTIPVPTVEWPASDPLVTGVGGTYLCTDPNNTTSRVVDSIDQPAKCQDNPGQAEIGWTFSGGGFSHVFGKPAYQNTLPAGSTAIGSMRGVPDIALQASAGTGALVYLTLPPDGLSGLLCGNVACSTGWYDIGGTSLSCPQWAGLVALADQVNGGGLGLINPALYKVASDPTRYANDFYDVTVGNNTAVTSVPGYPATTGWDPITGLGTPNAVNLIPDLVAAAH
jgi:subtilase family serine protease